MSSLSEWSDIIKRQGEEQDARWRAEAAEFHKLLPSAIEALRNDTPEDLLTRHLQFAHVGMNHYTAEDIGVYHNAIRDEILRRMNED